MRPQNNPKWSQRPRRPNKSQNNNNRALESTGPDMKIRGTASHIFRKYQHLARDAQMSGDRVRAENYLQHAEHYYRLAAESEQRSQSDSRNRSQNQPPRRRENRDWDQPPQQGNGRAMHHADDAPISHQHGRDLADVLPGGNPNPEGEEEF